MTNEPNVPATPVQVPQSTMKLSMVKLSRLVLKPELYCHRDRLELEDPAKLRSLADSIFATGLQVPIETAPQDEDHDFVISGNRRTSAIHLLVKEGKPGYTLDMDVPRVEVIGASKKQLVLRSVTDNSHRLTLTQTERIRAARTLIDNGAESAEAAEALGVTVKTLSRDLTIAENDWMFNLVLKHAVAPSTAAKLLETATAEKCVEQLREGVTRWVVATEARIAEDKKQKDLSAAKQLVKAYLTTRLVNHWLAQLKRKEALTPTAPPSDAAVAIDAEANRVSFRAGEIDLMAVPIKELAETISEVESVKRVMLSYLKARRATQGPQDMARQESANPTGLDVLRQEGMGDLADEIESMGEEEDEDGAEETAEGK